MRTRWLSVAGVQPRVVAVRLDVADLRAADEAGDAGQLDRDRLVVVARRGGRRSAAGDDPADRLGEPLGPDRLHHVVGGLQLERVDAWSS